MKTPARVTNSVYGGAAIFLAVAFFIGAFVTPANAADAPSAQATQVTLSPVGAAGQYFDLSLAAGQTVDLQLALGNLGSSVASVVTYKADASSVVNGGLGAADRASAPTGTSLWLDYATTVLTLSPAQTVTRSLRISVPAGTQPGQYITSIVVENSAPIRGSGSVAINQVIRHVMAVSISIPGQSTASFSLNTTKHTLSGHHSTISTQLVNDGTEDLKPVGTVQIRDQAGSLVSKADVQLESVFANTSTQVETTLGSELQAGNYTASYSLAASTASVTQTLPFTVSASQTGTATVRAGSLPQVLQSGSPLIVTVLVIAITVLIAALLGACFLLVRRSRKSSRS